ncbi:hypothetical protein VP01_799g4 [Puccinia sorghi]|uniref:Uncharacterized protein n=1 Tax=Puccinia sorghi TaxID=27349 RepID=A0A0L6UAQ1_9BASI|nr:hypothetical protein VP01_799g4 [Puccinia sorghi]
MICSDVARKATLDDQVKILLMLKKLPSNFHSFRNIVSMGFAAETFERILRRVGCVEIDQFNILFSACLRPLQKDRSSTNQLLGELLTSTTNCKASPTGALFPTALG